MIKNGFGSVKEKEFAIVLLFWISILFVSAIFGILDIVLLYRFVPFLTADPLFGWFIEMSEHYPMIRSTDELYKTRNRFGSGVEKFLTGVHNENYHLTHHLMPDIPCWNTRKAHEIMMKDDGYKEANEKMGGIFLSANDNPSLWAEIYRGYAAHSAKYQHE